jgi:hypothetical protein
MAPNALNIGDKFRPHFTPGLLRYVTHFSFLHCRSPGFVPVAGQFVFPGTMPESKKSCESVSLSKGDALAKLAESAHQRFTSAAAQGGGECIPDKVCSGDDGLAVGRAGFHQPENLRFATLGEPAFANIVKEHHGRGVKSFQPAVRPFRAAKLPGDLVRKTYSIECDEAHAGKMEFSQ